MKTSASFQRLVLGCIVALLLATSVHATVRKTTVVMPDRFEVPGAVLDAGTYVFRLETIKEQVVVFQVASADEKQVYATGFAIPDYRRERPDYNVVTYRQDGSCRAVKAYWPHNEEKGYRLIYGKKKAAEIAAACAEPVPAHDTVATVDTEIAVAEVSVHAPDGTEATYTTEAHFEEHDSDDSHGVRGQPASLPQTASSWPLALLLGFSFLGLGFALRFRA